MPTFFPKYGPDTRALFLLSAFVADPLGSGDAATKRRRTTIIVVPFAIMVVELAHETNGVASTPPDLQLQLNQVSNKIIFQWRTSPNQVAQLSWAT